VVITAGEPFDSMTGAYSVDLGSVSGMLYRANRTGTGSSSVTVHGSSLGLVAFTVMVWSGQTTCEGTVWESEISVWCKTGLGTRGIRRVVMTAGEQLRRGTGVYWMQNGMSTVTREYNKTGTESTSVPTRTSLKEYGR
jgi:hypothetical protein